jgi:hypothetical protein
MTHWQQIEELAKRATALPWFAKQCSDPGCWCKWIGTHPTALDEPTESGVCPTGALTAADADYIVAACNAAPDMAKEIRRLSEENARLKSALQHLAYRTHPHSGGCDGCKTIQNFLTPPEAQG